MQKSDSIFTKDIKEKIDTDKFVRDINIFGIEGSELQRSVLERSGLERSGLEGFGLERSGLEGFHYIASNSIISCLFVCLFQHLFYRILSFYLPVAFERLSQKGGPTFKLNVLIGTFLMNYVI